MIVFDVSLVWLHGALVTTRFRQPKVGAAQRTGAPTIGDVAALAGVSKMSVSRVLRDPLTVTEPIRGRIQRAIAQLNYVPNRAAQLLSGTLQFKIGLLYNYPRSAYAVDLLLGSMDQAGIDGVQLAVRGCMIATDDEVVLRDLLSQNVDAVILTPPLCESTELIDMLAQAEIPALLIGTSMRPTIGASLHIDEFAAAYEMTGHILGLGHTRIGFIEGGKALSASKQRLDGYRAALRDAGIFQDDSIIVSGLFTYRSGLKASEHLLSIYDRPSAIFASNDDMAAATIATAHRLGLDVPRDIAVCGFDDSWIATNIWPELTTVRQPVAAMGTQAVTILVQMLSQRKRGISANSAFVLPYKLIIRQSDGQKV